MTALLNDLRKITLVAGVAILTAAVWSLASQLLMRSPNSWDELFGIAVVALFTFLFAMPFPVSLLLLSRAGASLVVSRRLRRVTWALATIRGLELVNSGLDRWHASGDSADAVHAEMAAAGFSPFALSPVTHATSFTVRLVSDLAFILFLVALSQQGAPAADGMDDRKSRLVRKAALLAVIAGGVTMIAEFIAWALIAHEMREYGGPKAAIPTISSTLRGKLFLFPALIAPWIVRASLRIPPETADPGSFAAQPATT